MVGNASPMLFLLLSTLPTLLLLWPVASAANNTERTLQTWTKPLWWTVYRKEFGSVHVRKCLFLHNIIPVQDSTCKIFTSEWYMCLFGEQRCELNAVISNSVLPKTRCDCQPNNSNVWTWDCHDLEPCATAQPAVAPTM